MSGKQEKRKRKAAGIDLKAERLRFIAERERLEREWHERTRALRSSPAGAVAALLSLTGQTG